MSTDLAALLGKRKVAEKNSRNNDDDDDDDDNKPKRKGRKTKEERDAENLQLEDEFEEKYHCEHEAFTILSLETRPSRMDPLKTVTIVTWENNVSPPPQMLATMSQATQRLAMASKGGAHGQAGWHEQRDKRNNTASAVARGFCMSDPHLTGTHRVIQSFQNLFEQSNLVERFQGNELTEYGTKKEPFCCKVYMQDRYKNSLIRVGFIPHPTNPYCGATPDGVSLDGSRIMEFKCPMQRYFQEGDPAPIHYWHQCQFGMEVCAAAATVNAPRGSPPCFELCDYFEMKHMRRPRGLRTNCVGIRRDKAWFASIQPLLVQYDLHLKRLRTLASLFPSDMFNKSREIEKTTNTIPKSFKKIVLQE